MSKAVINGEKSRPSTVASVEIPDTQNLPDIRNVALSDVGIRGFRMPLGVTGWEQRPEARQMVTAEIEATVDLSPDLKGIHMSRITSALSELPNPLRLSELPAFLQDLRDRQNAAQARIDIRFTYFLQRQAPVSRASGPLALDCRYRGELRKQHVTLWQSVRVPVKTLCPCSKAISDYGAHNQRGYVTVELRHQFSPISEGVSICLEDVVQIIESSASAPIYPVLKRVDERHVTMQAYDNPTFVEDVARNVALQLREESRIDGFEVRVENLESIHDHSAYAVVRG